MKVYAVEFGEYSDRTLTGIYSTKERAEIAASPDGDVTEYELDQAFDLYDKGLRPFSVQMRYDGTVVTVESMPYWTERKADSGMATTENFMGGSWTWNCIRVTTWARDEQHAIKITNEHRAEAIAGGWDGVAHFNSKAVHA